MPTTILHISDLHRDAGSAITSTTLLDPGNHDISHLHVLRATELTALPADSEQRAILARQLREEDSLWRWVWPEYSVGAVAQI